MDKRAHIRRGPGLRLPVVLLAASFVGGAGYFFGYGRAAIALLMSAVVLYVGISYFRSAGEPAPEGEPEPAEGADIRYVCTVCGLEVKVVVATNDKPPTHCREKMQIVTAEDAPLRPVR